MHKPIFPNMVPNTILTLAALLVADSQDRLSCTQFSSCLHSTRVSCLPEMHERTNSKAAPQSNSSNMCVDMGSQCGCVVFNSQLVSVSKSARLERVFFTSGYKRSYKRAWCDSGLRGYLSWISESSSNRFLILFTLKQHFSIRCSNKQNKIASGSGP